MTHLKLKNHLYNLLVDDFVTESRELQHNNAGPTTVRIRLNEIE